MNSGPMTTIGVLDRTGTLVGPVEEAAAIASAGAEVWDLGSSVRFGAQAPRVDVLVLGPREVTVTALRRVARWHEAHPASAVVANVDSAIGWSRDELVAHGVRFAVRGEPGVPKLVRALRRCEDELARLADDVAEMAGPEPADRDDMPPGAPSWERAEEEAVATAEAQAADGPDAAGRRPGDGVLITIASATGGSGKTFYATNLAANLARRGKRVLLVDLDLQFGEVAPVLRLRHPYSVYDGLYGPGGEPLPPSALDEQLDRLVCHHELGFDVLTAPRDPSLADYVGARDAARVLDAVLPRYETVIVDTPPSLNEVVLVALDRSDVVPVLATLDVPSLKNLGVFLTTLRKLRIDDSHIRLLLNKVEADVGITAKQAQESFHGRFVAFVPADRSVSRSINSGNPIVESAPRSPVARALVEAINACYPQALGPPAAEPAAEPADRPRRWWQHIVPFRRLPQEA